MVDSKRLVFMLVYYVVALLSCVVLLLKRHKESVLHRKPMLNIVSTLGGMVGITMICIRESDKAAFPCAAYIVMSNLFLFLFTVPYIMRIINVALVYKWNMDAAHGDVHDKNFKGYEVVRNRTLTAWMAVIGVTFMIHMTFIAIQLSTIAVWNGKDYLDHGCDMDVELAEMDIIALCYCVTLCLCLVYWRNVREAYSIMLESRICLVIWTVSGVPFVIMTTIPALDWVEEYLFPHSVWIMACVSTSTLISNVLPLFVRSHKAFYRNEQTNKGARNQAQQKISALKQMHTSTYEAKKHDDIEIIPIDCSQHHEPDADVDGVTCFINIEHMIDDNERTVHLLNTAAEALSVASVKMYLEATRRLKESTSTDETDTQHAVNMELYYTYLSPTATTGPCVRDMVSEDHMARSKLITLDLNVVNSGNTYMCRVALESITSEFLKNYIQKRFLEYETDSCLPFTARSWISTRFDTCIQYETYAKCPCLFSIFFKRVSE